MKIKDLTGFNTKELVEGRHGSFTNYYDSDGNDLRGGNDEANLWYRYDPQDGRLKQNMIAGHQEREAHKLGYRDSREAALRVHGIVKSKYHQGKWIQNQGGKWVEVHPYGKPEVENEGIASAAMAKLPGFLNTIGKDSQSIAKIQDEITQRIARAGAGNPAVAHLNDAHSWLSQMYKNPTEEQAKAFYQAVQKANGAGIRESASAGATSAANIGTVDAPQLSPGKARGKKSYIGSPGKSGTKAPPQPKVVQPKTKMGTAVNGLDIKGSSLFGGPKKKASVIKRR